MVKTKNFCLAFGAILHLVCLILTIGMIINWSLQYTLDEDLSRIQYKHYHDTTEDVYPEISLCFTPKINPFKEKSMAEFDPPLTESSILQFLKGKEYDDRLLSLNYDDLRSFHLEDYVKKYWVRWQNGTTKSYAKDTIKENLFSISFTGFWRGKFYTCYGVQVPMKLLQMESNLYIEGFAIHISNSIFPKSVRPRKWDFVTFLHYPNQLLLSLPSVKYNWKATTNTSTYNMKYVINGMELLKRRQKDTDPCNENWKQFDDSVVEKNIEKVGCRAIYHKTVADWPLCRNKEDIQKANFPFSTDEIKKFDAPCKQVEKIRFTYEEMDYPDQEGTFWITMLLLDDRYKEIVQTR